MTTPSITLTIKPLKDVEKEILELEDVSRRAGDFPLIYDHSMYSTMQGCPRKGLLSYIYHLKPKIGEKPLVFGAAMHKGLQTYYEERVKIAGIIEQLKDRKVISLDDYRQKKAELLQQVLEAAKRDYVKEAIKDSTLPQLISQEPKYRPHSIERGFNLLESYVRQCPIEGDLWVVDSPDDVELGFAILIEVGEGSDKVPFIFVGKIDLLVRLLIDDGQTRAIVDHKTTTAKTKNWEEQWSPNNQLTGYMDGASQITGYVIRKAIINLLYFNKNIEEVGLYAFITRSEEDVVEWRAEMVHVFTWIKTMYDAWTQNLSELEKVELFNLHPLSAFPKNTGHCWAYRKACSYSTICNASNARMRKMLAAADYMVKPWKPYAELSRRGIGTLP